MANYSPEIPEFPIVNPFLPCYGKFDLTTYIQGASDYEIMANLVQLYNTMAKGYNDIKQLSLDLHTAYKQLENFVNTYLTSDEFKENIKTVLDDYYNNGKLQVLLASIYSQSPTFGIAYGEAYFGIKEEEKELPINYYLQGTAVSDDAIYIADEQSQVSTTIKKIKNWTVVASTTANYGHCNSMALINGQLYIASPPKMYILNADNLELIKEINSNYNYIAFVNNELVTTLGNCILFLDRSTLNVKHSIFLPHVAQQLGIIQNISTYKDLLLITANIGGLNYSVANVLDISTGTSICTLNVPSNGAEVENIIIHDKKLYIFNAYDGHANVTIYNDPRIFRSHSENNVTSNYYLTYSGTISAWISPTGSNIGTGSKSNPLLTIQDCINRYPTCELDIYIDSGTYAFDNSFTAKKAVRLHPVNNPTLNIKDMIGDVQIDDEITLIDNVFIDGTLRAETININKTNTTSISVNTNGNTRIKKVNIITNSANTTGLTVSGGICEVKNLSANRELQTGCICNSGIAVVYMSARAITNFTEGASGKVFMTT